jgi:hypothetical protein
MPKELPEGLVKRRLSLLDGLMKAQEDFQRWYSRLQRAARALEKARKRVVRYQRAIDVNLAELNEGGR